MKGARPEAATVAAYILSVQGQQILANNGFSTVTTPPEPHRSNRCHSRVR